MTGPLLVIAHEATRTGSPRVLLELLRHAAPLLPGPIVVTLLAGGGLADELRSVSADVDPADPPAAVLINGSMAAVEMARFGREVPVAVYVHEEGDALGVLSSEAKVQLATRADLVLCVSENSRRDLIALGVPEERTSLLRPVIVERARPTTSEVTEARTALVGAGAHRVVIGCGDAGWRKGADLFLDVARRLAPHAGVAFAWVGGGSRAFGRILRYDTQWLGLGDRVRWLGEVNDVDPFLAAADLLVFPSREDPQPLVPLEAAFMGTATVGFSVGGLATLAEYGAVAAVPYPDTVKLADAAAGLLADASARGDLVGRAVGWARSEQSMTVQGGQFVEQIGALMRRASVPT